MNPTTYRSMRDHIHPPRVSAPSGIIPPAEDVAVSMDKKIGFFGRSISEKSVFGRHREEKAEEKSI